MNYNIFIMESIKMFFVLLAISRNGFAKKLDFSQLRLVNGSGEHEGRVEVLKDGVWGTICNEDWGQLENEAVCRYLNYPYRSNDKKARFFGQGTGPILFDKVTCDRYKPFDSCVYPCSGVRKICDHSKDVGVKCPLYYRFDRSGRYEGRMLVRYKSRYGSICNTGFGPKEAGVVCRGLGYSAEGAQVKTLGKGTVKIWLDYVKCTGEEYSLNECSNSDFGNVSCSTDQGVGVICKQTPIRLIGGVGQFDGKVEIFHNNQWGSICYNTDTTKYDGYSLCGALGASRIDGTIRVYTEKKNVNTEVPAMLKALECESGSKIQFCPGFCWGEKNCTNYLYIDCGINIRLVGGSGPHEGRLEVYYRGWGTVCDANIGQKEANVVCKHLGFQGDGASVRHKSYFGGGTGDVLVDSIDCQGSESDLAKCRFIGLGSASCDHSNDVSIVCKPTKYRLVGGKIPGEGRVEVHVNGVWGTVCDNGWTNYNAYIVCEELGFPTARALFYGGAYFGEGSGPIWLDNVKCTRREKSLSTCEHSDWGVTNCKHNGDVSVLCRPSVRLVRGPSPNQGRVEYYVYAYDGSNSWRTLCDSQFGTEEAEVVCRELGFPTEGAMVKRGAFFGEGTGPIHSVNFNCSGTEATITACKTSGSSYCTHTKDVSVICPGALNLYVNPEVNVTTERYSSKEMTFYRFYCDFSEVKDTFFYKTFWYINGEVVYQSQILKGDSSNLRKGLSVTDDELNRKVGYDILCKVHVSEAVTSTATVSSSKPRFIGIQVVNPVINLKDRESGVIRIKATAEIGCFDKDFPCPLFVSAIIPDASTTCGEGAKINNMCGVTIITDAWNKEYAIHVTPDIPHSYKDYSRKFEVALNTGPYTHHNAWNFSAILPRITVIVERDTKLIESLVCKTVGDPRLHTFMGLNINLNYPGTYTLYYDRESDIEVQIQTAPCSESTAYCNCGMIARVGGTAYMINKCNSQNWIIEYVKCDDGVNVLKVERHGNYKITFRTGTYVIARLLNGNPPKFVDVDVYPSILDAKKPRGLCGKISEEKENQLVMRDNHVTSDAIKYDKDSMQDAENFVSSWSVEASKNLFDPDVRDNLPKSIRDTVTCKCDKTNNGERGDLTCDAESPVEACTRSGLYKAVSKRSCKVASQSLQRKRRSVTDYIHKGHTRAKRTAQWSNGWTEETATQYCIGKFNESALIQICKEDVPSISLNADLEVCKEDIKLLGTTDFVSAAIESLKGSCVHEVTFNTTLQTVSLSSNESSVFEKVTREDCSEECKKHGSCVKGTCVCDTGYIGVDCTININTPPKADEVEFEGMCDLKTSNCSDIALFGELFTDEVHMECKVGHLQLSKQGVLTSISNPRSFSAEVESLSEVVCPLPDLTNSEESIPKQQETFTVFNLSVSYNSVDYSNQLSMVVFNSDCMTCSKTGGVITCSTNPDYCVTDNKCYNVNETYPLNEQYICTANTDGATWQINGSDPNSPCEEANRLTLPSAEFRSTTYQVSPSFVINDLFLYEGWYGEVGKIIPYGAAPQQNYCSTRFPIYLSNQPSESTGEEQSLKACVRRYSNTCYAEIDVRAMYCGNDLFVYYLKSSPIGSSGYCLSELENA